MKATATQTPLDVPREAGRFFRRLDWTAFWAATLVTFAVYFYTLPPTVTLEDAGELAVAGDYLGVPHPPGYPIWTILAWVFSKVFSFVTFRGQPNPAWSIALLSGVFGAVAAGLTAMLICRSASDILRESRQTLHNVDESTEAIICWIGGVSSSLLFAFSPVMWSQSVIVEVYSLNAFFLMLIFLLTYRWVCRPTDLVLYATAFVFGLGLTNYQVLLLAALPLIVVIMLRDIALFRDFLIVGIPYAAVLGLIQKGVLPAVAQPADTVAVVYVLLNFLVLGMAFFLLPRGRTVALTILMAEIGVAFYVYMPIVSDLRNPPMNWGYPRTWEGFKHALTRGQYERIAPADVLSPAFIEQIGDYLSDVRGQFTLPVALLGFLPFTVWQVKMGQRRLQGLYAAILLAIGASAVVTIEEVWMVAWPGLPALYKLLSLGVILILVIGGAAIFVTQAREFIARLRARSGASLSERFMVGLVLLGALLVFLLYAGILLSRMVSVTAPLRTAGEAVAGEQLKGIFLQVAVISLLIALPIALVAALTYLMRSRHEFRLTISTASGKWMIATLSGFLMMSIMLIALANPKGDIQDSFIQRVKFISSHALYTLWIGYGLIFGLAFVDTLFKKSSVIKWLSLATALALPMIPIQQNLYNADLVRIFGGAEQNGHDFGWQFGNYQLRGAAAITEELSPEEEPLPNPSFPAEMGPDAIFFGGTDPGRFVPTYMIYSARVREDVYLITQNALADNTYMSVMRDLYGDQIWIPAQPDSARAFQVYVEEVQSGKRPRNAQLTIENGRVQVSGALGVMEINGILAQMIFEHNKYKHSFYVEESYVIQWMYPYLEPHGLIMKINPERAMLRPETVRDDMDLWDWYVRRFISNEKFLRDVVASKSFSKLRSALAGVYAFWGRLPEAENAFQHARILYALSPEANFRLVQEVFMRQNRLAEAQEVMEEFGKADPENSKVPEFLQHLKQIQQWNGRISELEALMSQGKLDVERALELATIYQQAGQNGKFMGLAMGMVQNTNLPGIVHFRVAQLLSKAGRINEMVQALEFMFPRIPPEAPAAIYLDVARMYATARRPDRMAESLTAYLKREPADWKAWLDLAALQMGANQRDQAVRSLQQAVGYGGNEALNIINQDRRFAAVYNEVLSRAQNLMNLPGIRP